MKLQWQSILRRASLEQSPLSRKWKRPGAARSLYQFYFRIETVAILACLLSGEEEGDDLWRVQQDMA